jgi:hypothetical protein
VEADGQLLMGLAYVRSVIHSSSCTVLSEYYHLGRLLLTPPLLSLLYDFDAGQRHLRRYGAT